MGTLELFKSYFTPRRKGTLSLSKLESKLRTHETGLPQRRTLLWAVAAVFVVTVVISIARRGIHVVQEYLPQAMAGLPPEAQWSASALLVLALAGGIGHTISRLFSRVAERRTVEMHIQKARADRKMMVYAYGSGAKGFMDAIERLSQGALFKYLYVFAQPPLDAVKRGFLRIKGSITACIPVQSAKGTYMAAAAARSTEARLSDEGHDAFLDAIGAEETSVEWSMIHVGEGHTSISCHTAWEEKRTTMNRSALPGRFVVVVRDARDVVLHPEEDGPGDEELIDTDDSPDHRQQRSDIAPASLVRVTDGVTVGSGIVMDRNGLILTAAHVVGDSASVDVRIGDLKDIEAAVIYKDQSTDVAFLKVESSESLIPVVKGNSDDLEIGDRVVAHGYPADLEYEGMPVAALGSVVDITPDGPCTVIKSDAMVTAGCSGGPLLTLDGRFVGMVTSTTPGQDISKLVTCALSSQDVLDALEGCGFDQMSLVSGTDGPGTNQQTNQKINKEGQPTNV